MGTRWHRRWVIRCLLIDLACERIRAAISERNKRRAQNRNGWKYLTILFISRAANFPPLFHLLFRHFVAFCKVSDEKRIEHCIHCNAAVIPSDKFSWRSHSIAIIRPIIFNLILCYYSITLYLMCSNKRSTLFMAGKNCDGDRRKNKELIAKRQWFRSHEIVEIERRGISNIQLWRCNGEAAKSKKCSLNWTELNWVEKCSFGVRGQFMFCVMHIDDEERHF